MKSVPIETISLFSVLEKELIILLKSLSAEDWNKPTRAKQWTVKNIASHLLDGNMRTLSISRDGYYGDSPGAINSYQDLIDYLNRLNADWVQATKRLSPDVLIGLMEITGRQYIEHLKSLDPFSQAVFSVGWAGEETSENWFHIAREYTEKWHHQQQIREAVGKTGVIETRELYHPVLRTFMHAMPHRYRDVKAEKNSAVNVYIAGEAGGTWSIVKSETWMLEEKENAGAKASIRLSQQAAWKLFTKGLTKDEAALEIGISGDPALGIPMLDILGIMA